MFSEYEEWEFQKRNAAEQASPLKLLVPIAIQFRKWLEWCEPQDIEQMGASVRAFLNAPSEDKCRHVFNAVCEFDGTIGPVGEKLVCFVERSAVFLNTRGKAIIKTYPIEFTSQVLGIEP